MDATSPLGERRQDHAHGMTPKPSGSDGSQAALTCSKCLSPGGLPLSGGLAARKSRRKLQHGFAGLLVLAQTREELGSRHCPPCI